jgi:hypothetical protein
VVPALRGPEKFFNSQKLKPRLSREVAPAACLEKICVYGLINRRSPKRLSFNQTLHAVGEKWANLIEKSAGDQPARGTTKV